MPPSSFLGLGVTVERLARAASKREMDAAELDRGWRDLEQRRRLRRRVASLEKDLDESVDALREQSERLGGRLDQQSERLGGRLDAIEHRVLAEFELRLRLLEEERSLGPARMCGPNERAEEIGWVQIGGT